MSIISGAATYLRTVRSAFGRSVVPGRSADTPDGSPAEGDLESPKEGFRPDVEGLRALARAVLLYHAGVPFAPGGYVGVDVFFVISGYLITGLLLRELETGTLSLARFYSRRAKRLLPLTVVVLGAVVLVVGMCHGLTRSAWTRSRWEWSPPVSTS